MRRVCSSSITSAAAGMFKQLRASGTTNNEYCSTYCSTYRSVWLTVQTIRCAHACMRHCLPWQDKPWRPHQAAEEAVHACKEVPPAHTLASAKRGLLPYTYSSKRLTSATLP